MYNFLVHISNLVILVAALFSKKISLMRRGRKSTFEILEASVIKRGVGVKTFWVHCASLGEFEQGRPVIERLRNRYPDAFIAISFFSPSGYEIRKNYEVADVVFYLPSDTKSNMKRLVKILKPDVLFVVKYEFWYNMLKQAKMSGCKVYLFSALFLENMIFFKKKGGFFRAMLKFFDGIYVQDTSSKELLAGLGHRDNVFVTGDTRFDRVVENKLNYIELPLIRDFVRYTEKVVVCGSTWNADMDILIPLILSCRECKFIIAPHEINEEVISSIEAALMSRGVVRYTNTTKYDNLECPNVMIIDCIGILNSVYQYGTRAYIGGGFGAGIHNILEAAVWGLPLIFGPNYGRFKEAVDLVESGGAHVVRNFDDLKEQFIRCGEGREHEGDLASSYVEVRKGASDMILDCVFGKSAS